MKNKGETGWDTWVVDGKNHGNGKDFARNSCENGTLKLYAEVDIYKISASWYFKGDILVKKVFETYYDGDVIKDRIYPCKSTDDPEAAAACNNHWCSWEMDKEKAACYKNLCQHSATPEDCFHEKCRNDWSPPPTPRTTALDPLDEAVEERKTKTDTPHDTAPAPQGVSDQQAAGSSPMTLQSEVDNEPLR